MFLSAKIQNVREFSKIKMTYRKQNSSNYFDNAYEAYHKVLRIGHLRNTLFLTIPVSKAILSGEGGTRFEPHKNNVCPTRTKVTKIRVGKFQIGRAHV